MKDVAFAGTESGFDFLRCRRAMTGTVALGVTIFSVGVAAAQDPFAVNITVDASTVTQTNDNLEDFISLFSNAELAALVPGYIDDFSPADFTLDFRGLPATASYALGSTDLVLEIPAADINETFTGATRDDSEDAFFEFLEGNGEEILTRLLQALARETPIDPYAGNPSSLVGRSITADFGIGRFNLSNAAGAGPGRNGVGGEGSPPNLFSLGFQFGHYTPRGTPSTSELGGREYEVNTFTLPINYVRAVGDSGFALVFDAPLTYIDTGGAVSGSASFAFGVQAPLSWLNGKTFAGVEVLDWRVTPVGRIGGVGSVDLGSAAASVSGSLTSSLYLGLPGGLELNLVNLGSYTSSIPIEFNDYNVDYDLSNSITRNGLFVTKYFRNFKVFGASTSVELGFVDTRYFGDELFISNYQEYSLSFGTRAKVEDTGWSFNRLRIGGTYTDGENGYEGFLFNLGYTF